jgi:hypothetical protein
MPGWGWMIQLTRERIVLDRVRLGQTMPDQTRFDQITREYRGVCAASPR